MIGDILHEIDGVHVFQKPLCTCPSCCIFSHFFVHTMLHEVAARADGMRSHVVGAHSRSPRLVSLSCCVWCCIPLGVSLLFQALCSHLNLRHYCATWFAAWNQHKVGRACHTPSTAHMACSAPRSTIAFLNNPNAARLLCLTLVYQTRVCRVEAIVDHGRSRHCSPHSGSLMRLHLFYWLNWLLYSLFYCSLVRLLRLRLGKTAFHIIKYWKQLKAEELQMRGLLYGLGGEQVCTPWHCALSSYFIQSWF